MRADGSGATTGTWRHGREVFDAYDADRVLSEGLADDLVNDLMGLRARARPVVRGPFRVARVASAARRRRPRTAVHLRPLGGGLEPA